MNWQGLSGAESLALWDRYDWRLVAMQTFRQVATCTDTHIDNRVTALTWIDLMVQAELVADPTAAEFIVAALLQMAVGHKPRGWWGRRRAAQTNNIMAARLSAAINGVKSMIAFKNSAAIQLQLAPGDHETLLS